VVRVAADAPDLGRYHFVIKRLSGFGMRETGIYPLLKSLGLDIAPQILEFQQLGDAGFLCLEWVPSSTRWPWRDEAAVQLVTDNLARLHREKVPQNTWRSAWAYDRELHTGAVSSLAQYLNAQIADSRPMVRTLERLAEQLSRIRKELLRSFGPALIHGDAHPGNALIQGTGRARKAVLIDWGRTRIGSPMEDLASWLQTLAFWEPSVRRRHDRYLRQYRILRGWAEWPDAEFREFYWLASASNAFGGALTYHLAVAGDAARPPRQREVSRRAALDWLRILRRADAYWRAGRS
jgi:aminoglycoside phosphotransferase (APT) family kinase protein